MPASFCRHVCNAVRFQKGDQLIAPDIEKQMPQMSAFLDLYRVGDDRLKAKDALVKLAGLVQIECRETNMGKSSVTHLFYSSHSDSWWNWGYVRSSV
jgi:hypothetical protein